MIHCGVTYIKIVEAQLVIPLLLGADDAAKCLGIGRSLFLELDGQGRVPQAIKLGDKRKLWRLAELTAWTNAGCPHRDRWKFNNKG
jgi:predicted DNA-binding transcriptional regulator AlpA